MEGAIDEAVKVIPTTQQFLLSAHTHTHPSLSPPHTHTHTPKTKTQAYSRRAEEEGLGTSSFSTLSLSRAGLPSLGARFATRASLVGAELLLGNSPPKVIN